MISKRKRSDSTAKKVAEIVFKKKKLRILVKKTMLAVNILKVEKRVNGQSIFENSLMD